MLKVFISSVVKGYEQFRKIIKEELEKTGMFDIYLSEFESARPMPSLKYCEELANQCNIFLLFLGSKYGTVIKDLGISVTEFEYKKAKEENPDKILVFIEDLKEEEIEEEQRLFINKVMDLKKGYFVNKFSMDDISLLLKKMSTSLSDYLERITKYNQSIIRINPFEDFDFSRFNKQIDINNEPYYLIKAAPFISSEENIDSLDDKLKKILDFIKYKRDYWWSFISGEKKRYGNYIQFLIRNNKEHEKFNLTICDLFLRFYNITNTYIFDDRRKLIIHAETVYKLLLNFFIFIKNFYYLINKSSKNNITIIYFSIDFKEMQNMFLELPNFYKYLWYYSDIYKDELIFKNNELKKIININLEDNLKNVLDKLYKEILRDFGFDYLKYDEEGKIDDFTNTIFNQVLPYYNINRENFVIEALK